MYKIYEINENDKYYPKNLLKVKTHPKKLYVIGNKKILNNKSVAIVGSRDNSSYGEYYAKKFSKEISSEGITIISGLAIGIDTIAHENSFNQIGKTIAVIGSGLNNIYPKINENLVGKIIENGGAVISEFEPDVEANLSKFPKRNRIIAGMSECVIVVEAKFRSGSSITATQALKNDKKVFCIPGRIGDKRGVGTNNLIKKGANLLTDVNQILNLFEIEKTVPNETKIKISKQYKDIYKLVEKYELNINEISHKLNINIAELNMKLTMMELENLIEINPGGLIKLKKYKKE